MLDAETSQTSRDTAEIINICDRLRDMGFAQSRRIRIYGQDFELVSNPFPEGNGVAVRAVARRETHVRIVKIPIPVLQTVARKKIA